MSRVSIGYVDSSVLFLLAVSPEDPGLPEALRTRVLRTHARMSELHRDGVVFRVPAPVVVELSRDGPGKELGQRVLAAVGGLQVDALDLIAAEVAGEMIRPALLTKPTGEGKRVIRMDAMIAAIAHTNEARYLLTANPGDFATYLGRVQSKTEVIAVDQIHAKGQLTIVAPALSK